MRKATIFTAVLLLIVGMSPGQDGKEPPAKPGPKANLWAGLAVTSPIFGADDVTDARFFMASFALVNDGDKHFAPTEEVNNSKLLINGKELKEWPHIINNGPREASGTELKPGESLRFGKAIGKYCMEPGIYKVQWKGKSFESSVVEFRVLPAVGAARPGEKPQAATPAERLKALVADAEAARQAFLKATNDGDPLKTPKTDYVQARQQCEEVWVGCAAGLLDLADKHPGDPAALDAILWVLRNRVTGAPAHPRMAGVVRDRSRAVNLLRRDHLANERLGDFLRLFGFGVIQFPESVKVLEEVLAKSPHRAVQAVALMRLADYKLSYASGYFADLFKDPDQTRRQLESRWGKELINKALEADPKAMRREGEKLYERLAKEYADVPDREAGTIGKLALLKLAAMREPLVVGRPAPPVEGANVDGKELKLRDYHSKVVLLVFTSGWTNTGEDLHPEQRSLAKKFAGRPLALLDVNSDKDLDRRKKLNAKDQITWPAIQWTDAEGARGPIATRWGIDRWPTLFLIDHKGVIRQKYVGDPGEEVLAQEIEKLVHEAEAGGKE